MRQKKSDRIKKLESELEDLERWLKLGLVPKKDIEKHKEEIESVKKKISDETARLEQLKQEGLLEDYIAPKRVQQRTAFTDMPSLPDVDPNEEKEGASFDTGEEGTKTDAGETVTETEYEDEDEDTESFFRNRNRWGEVVDPEANDW